jgi:hypothetical protein
MQAALGNTSRHGVAGDEVRSGLLEATASRGWRAPEMTRHGWGNFLFLDLRIWGYFYGLLGKLGRTAEASPPCFARG